MQNSILRMSGLIDNVLDFARGRLGGGMTLDLGTGQLDEVLQHVINELRAVNPDREIITSFDVADDVHADQHRIAQLFSNLLGNALTHGSAEHPVRAEARTEFGNFILSVSNGGTPIDEAALAGMFQPFQRSGDRHRGHQQGLGLGLYIASRIAEAHGGKLTVSSNPSLTTFTFTMPVHAQNAAAGRDQAAAE
jgi:signal transduction histidine kinase